LGQAVTRILAALALAWLVASTCHGADTAAASPWLAHRAVVFGQRLRYIESGSGSALILIHGLADNLEVWKAVIPVLAQHYRVIALDQIGFGQSDKPVVGYRPQTLVDFLDEFMQVRGLAHAVLVGNSLGGWVAALMAIEHPARVDALVLVDSAGLAGLPQVLGPRAFSALRLASMQDLQVLTPLTFADPQYYRPEALRQAFTERLAAGDGYAVSQIVDAMSRGEDAIDDRLDRIHSPTLIIWGNQDRLIPLHFGQQLYRQVSGSQLVVLPHCAHEPEVECPGRFQTVLQGFLRQLH
jgi:pimeloyl-ACP methyl ester carboxylesterase